jgi:hypothetical protein
MLRCAFFPPLIVKEAEIDELFGCFEKAPFALEPD